MNPKIYPLAGLLLVAALAGCAPGARRVAGRGPGAVAATATVTPAATETPPASRTPPPPTVTAIPAAPKTATPTPLPPLPTRPPVAPSTRTPTPTRPAAAARAATPASLPQVEVLAFALNVRPGPGPGYPVETTLQQGDTVTITGVNYTGEWFRVARNGEPIGWISASPAYVRPLSPVDAVPAVAAPSLPAVQGTLVLQSESGGPFYLFTPGSTDLRFLSAGIDPALSPDGTRIAFTRWGSGEMGELWLYDVATGQEWPLLGEMFEPKAPTWSPDGTQLVISYQHGGRREIESRCYGPRSDGTYRKPPPGAFDFRFYGLKLCFKLFPDTHWQLRKVDAAGGAFDDLPSQTYSFAPTWDPANTWRIIFAGSTGLQQLDLNRGEYWAFSDDVRDHAPVISPDGSRVAVSYRQHTHWEIYTISTADGSRARLTPAGALLEEPFNSAAPAWSPDGNKIAFVTDRAGQWEFWVMNADGSAPRPLLPAEVAAGLEIRYNGVDERLISWGQ